MANWFAQKICKICGSLLATDGEKHWCVNDCECNRNVTEVMIYGNWIEMEEEEE